VSERQESGRTPLGFTNPRQERIHRRLVIVGQGPAAFYKDACRLMSEQVPYESTTHLVGHLLRETESALRQMLETAADETVRQRKSEEGHKDSIRAILKGLEVAESDPVSESMAASCRKGRVWTTCEGTSSRLSEPRPLNEEFREFWNQMEVILDGILDKFEEHYLVWLKRIELLAQKEQPTRDDVKFLRNKIPNSLVAFGHFV
jgi:hypothetical protein